MLKRVVFTVSLVLLTFGTSPRAKAMETQARASIVLEAATGQVFFEENADEPLGMASTTKIMTALVALENAEIDGLVTVPESCVGIEGSSLYLKAGEQLSLRELLYGLMLESGNDAAEVIAVHVAGSRESFVDMMNRRALSLGCTHTHFDNPSGLTSSEHYASARDMAIIMAAAMENPIFEQITATRSITFQSRSFTNHNKLLWSCEGCIGGKTGYTKSSGRTLVTCVEREGMRLICVTLDDRSDWEDHVALYEELFSKWQVLDICHAGVNIGTVPVIAGVQEEVSVMPECDLRVVIERGKVPAVCVELPYFVYAEVQADSEIGVLRVLDGEQELASTGLVCSMTVPQDKNQKLTLLERLQRRLGFFPAAEQTRQ